MLTKPPLEKLALDPAYQGYVLLAYQAAVVDAAAAQRRAEAERQRAETERRRADSLNVELQQALAELARLRSGEEK